MKRKQKLIHRGLLCLIIGTSIFLSTFPARSQVTLPPHGHQIIRTLPQREFQKIRHFQVIDSNQDAIKIEASLQSFSLSENQNFASFEMTDTLIKLGDIPEDAQLVPDGFLVRGENNAQYYFQFLLSEEDPFQVDPSTGMANGSIILQAIESNVESLGGSEITPIKLMEPIELNFKLTGMEDQKVFVEQLNWPPIEVDFTINPQITYPEDQVTTKMFTIFKHIPYETQLSVRPYVKIRADKDSIQGFGIQTTPVRVSIEGTKNYPDITVGLSTDKGYFDPDQIKLTLGTTSTVYLRSERIGEAKIWVEASGMISNIDTVYFVFPWAFLLFSIIGAVIGSLIRIFRIKKKPFDARSFIVGILLGFTVSVCYWALGIDLLNLDLDVGYINEFAILALSILGGLLGGYIGRTKE